MPTKHVAVKARISSDDEKRGEGVSDQIAWGTEYANDKWPELPVEVYADNSITAADRDVVRPEFNRLCANIKVGKVAHLVATNRNRVTRDAGQWFDLVDDLFLPAGIDVIHTKHRGVMPVDDLVADFDAVLGRREVRVIRRLVRDKMERLADQGRPRGGYCYGYESGIDEEGRKTLLVIPDEAEVVRWMAEAVLAGWTMTAIAKELNRRGVPTKLAGHKKSDARRGRSDTVSGRWWQPGVRSLLTSPTIAGLRVHNGEVHRQGTWEPILDEITWRRVCATLEARRRPPSQARSYLLTGIAVCGRGACGSHLTGTPHHGKPAYWCQTNAGCKRLSIVAEPFEEEVRRRVFERLDSPEFRAALARDDHEARRAELTGELADIEQQHVHLARRWAVRDDLPDAAWDAARGELDARKSQVQAALLSVPAPRADFDPDFVRSRWPELTFDEQRHALRLMLHRVRVMPAEPGRRFNPARVVIEPEDWRI